MLENLVGKSAKLFMYLMSAITSIFGTYIKDAVFSEKCSNSIVEHVRR